MSSDDPMTMLLVGDVFVRRDDPPSVFQHVREILRDAEFTFGNLEGSVADLGTPWHKSGATNWKADARQIAAVESAGFDAMSVANNHMLDFGHDAMLETLTHLDRLGIAHSGAGQNVSEARAPAIVERNGCRIALLGYTSVFMDGWEAGDNTPGLAVIAARTAYEPPPRFREVPGMAPIIRSWVVLEHKEQLRKEIEAARERADIVVCAFHWGVSLGFRALTEYQVELGRFAVDAGADLVFGHHPHLLQGVEAYRGRAIFYSLGNWTFARHNPTHGQELETILVRCRIRDRKIDSVEYLPARGDEEMNPHVLDPELAEDIVRLVATRSAQFGTRFEQAGDAFRLVLDGA